MNVQAVFIDRDGTIGGNDTVIYPGKFELFPGVQESIRILKNTGVLTCSFTNQPGIARGEARIEDFEKELKDFGMDRIFLCPHQHTEGCKCRKPSPGMLLKAAEENYLELKNCVVIGDRWTDLVAADEVGCMKILVKTGSGTNAYEEYINNEYVGRWGEIKPDFVASDFNEAVRWMRENL
ncbi:HAD-IIIA family hydrolase [Robertmurraya sp. Marseille-Q9965]